MVHWNSSPHPISDIRDWSEAGRLELRPDFQRRGVWSSPARIMLMDTILRDVPIVGFHVIIFQKGAILYSELARYWTRLMIFFAMSATSLRRWFYVCSIIGQFLEAWLNNVGNQVRQWPQLGILQTENNHQICMFATIPNRAIFGFIGVSEFDRAVEFDQIKSATTQFFFC